MKKIVVIFLCLTLAVAAILPTVVFAEESASSSAEDIIYFLNPTAITAVGDYLFVADKIEDNRSAILCFDISNDTPVYRFTYEINGNVSNLAAKRDSGLYVILSDKIVELTVGASLTEANSWNVTNAVDVAYGVDGSRNTEYILKTDELVRNGVSGNLVTLTNAISCVAIGDDVFYMYKDGSNVLCKDYDGNQHTHPANELNNANPADPNYYLTGVLPKGMLVWNDKVTLFTDSLIRSINFDSNTCSLFNLLNYASAGGINPENASIEDVAAQNGKLFILNDKNKIEVYKNSETNSFELVATIGSDEVHHNVPTVGEYSSFTLVRAKGYPANIVFKTTSQNSVANIKTDASEYIVIGYDGDASSNFYYVFVRDDNGDYKFGWVKKSDTATSVFNDDKLEVVNTNLSNDGNVQYKTVFSSLNTVWIFDVPCSQFQGHAFSQTASNMTEVTILQEFVEITSDGQIVWLYVEYESNSTIQHGFVKKQEVGSFYPTVEQTAVIAYCKINSTLFSSVKLYMYGDPDKMTDDNLAVYTKTVTDADGEKTVVEETVPPLHSGQKVSVISEENGIALVQIQRGDGAIAYGYLYSDRLIDAHALTTNAIVGLVLLLVAIALGVALAVIFVRRRKKLKADAEPAPAEKE